MRISLFALFLLASLVLLGNSTPVSHLLTGEYDLTQQDLETLYSYYRSNYAAVSRFSHLFQNLTFQENAFRFSIFANNLETILQHNRNPSKQYSQGINLFTGLSSEEKRKYIISEPQNCSATAEATLRNPRKPNLRKVSSVPAAIDWRDKGVVSPVKDQGDCGSCWTFSTTGCIESHWSIKTGKAPVLLSEQQLLDCAGGFNNFGCNGGLPSQAFEYVRYQGGIDLEDYYPYESVEYKCRYSPDQVGASVPGGSVNITAYDENGILEAVATKGPVSIAFEVTDDFFNYETGVYSNPSCHKDPGSVNHAVLIVGYGVENGVNYWIVKNSWADSWGDQGYFKILRGDNECGLATCASYPDVGN